MVKKCIAMMLSVLMLVTLVPHGVLANVTPLSSLAYVEGLLYGQVQTGSLLERIERVEKDIYGSTQEGAVLVRIDRIQTFLQSTEGEGGLQVFLNLAEWGFSASIAAEKPMLERLTGLEEMLYGGAQSGPISKRTERLMQDIWGTTRLDVKRVTLPAKSLVKVMLLKTVDSSKEKVGDEVLYQVVEDVMVDGRIVVPAGVTGKATVSDVTAAGRLGKDGRIVLDFNHIPSLDGSMIKLKVDETATEKNQSLELAAGASMAGIVLLGPVGLVGGYFVKGKDVKIEANTHFFVETEKAVPVSGFYFRPAP